MPAKINLIGKQFGRLKVIGDAEPLFEGRDQSSGRFVPRSICICDCGAKKIIRNSSLRRGLTRSCGCFDAERRLKHGHSREGARSGAYKSWNWMLQRCTNPRNDEYHRYGGSGITVCERWKSFENFLADMGERPDGLTIERIDGKGIYEPGNCRWATRSEQNRNKGNTKVLTLRGIKGPLVALCEHFGVPFARANQRLLHGWDLESTLFRPKMINERDSFGRFAGLKFHRSASRKPSSKPCAAAYR